MIDFSGFGVGFLSSIRFRVAGLMACGFALAATDARAETAPFTPERLRCEYLVNPLGIESTQPRLDWILQGTAETPRNTAQSAYHILVASTPELLAQEKGDLWDSGEVKSGDTSYIAYAGTPLTSREICYWKVRSTDTAGHASAWSQPASWEMGLLKPEDWQAKWIDAPNLKRTQITPGDLSIVHASYEAVDGSGGKDVTDVVAKMVHDNALLTQVNNDIFGGDPTPNHAKQLRVTYAIGGEKHEQITTEVATLSIAANPFSRPYLRKDFTVTKTIAKARVYVTALGLYELHLNGQKIGDHLLAPDWTDYNKRVRYQVYDVTSLVKSGANTLGGLLGNGWYAGHIGNGGYQAWGTVPALFAQLEVTYADGSIDRIVTDASWKMHASAITSSDFMLGENYDAREEVAGWDKPGLDVSSWSAANERTEPARAIEAQVDQPVRQTGEIHPKSMPTSKPGDEIYDFGQNMVGFLRIKVHAPAGTVLTLRHAEMLNPDGTLYTTNLRGAPSIDTYTCKGGGHEEIWQPHFTFHGFRYAELIGMPVSKEENLSKLLPPAITGIVIGTDFPHTGQFATSDANINQLQSNIQWGMRGNYLSVPTDCPQRDERMGWMGDAEVFIRSASYNGDIAAFFTKWLVDVDDAQKPDGAFTDVSPSPNGRGGGNGGVPAWADAGVICPWTIYMMYGDKRILEKHLPAMTRWVDWCKDHSTNLIRDHDRGPDYGDWLAQGEDAPKDLIGTAYFAYSTSLLAKSYQAVGDSANAQKYGDLFNQIKAAFNQKYVSADGHIQGNTQTGYCMALRFGLLPDELRPKAAQYLADNVAAHNFHLTTGFVGGSYLLPALCLEDKIDTAYRLFLQDTFPSWLFSVKHGATTIWERWDGWTPEKGFQDPGMNSFNHYALGSCGEWMFHTVAGIEVDPEQPGFKHILIRPRPGGTLTEAEGTYDSINGKIATKWTVKDGKFSLHVTIPINTTATVELPTTNVASVQEGGHDLANSSEIKPVSGDDKKTRFTIGSGEYDFTCSMP